MTEGALEPLVLGRYLLFDAIGGGGMATVHLARALGAAGFSRVVAIKRVHPARATDANYATMLLDEARVTARIRHPNVVPTLDVVSVGSELVLVMDYVHGPSLSWLMRALQQRGERAPVPVVLRMVLDMLAGLHAAHEATSERGRPLEIIHRDVSPHNVLIGEDGSARIADFGIAKANGKLSLTLQGQIKGKVSYMAPEQLRNEPLDRRVDVFATGIVLWELLTGHGLFRGAPGQAAMIQKILFGGVEPPSRHAAIPEALESVVMTALAVDRDHRFATADAMASALASSSEIASSREVAAWVAVIARDLLATRSAMVERVEQISAIHDIGPRSLTEPELPALAERPRGSKVRLIVLTAATLLAAAVLVLAAAPRPALRAAAPSIPEAPVMTSTATTAVPDVPLVVTAQPVAISSTPGAPATPARATTTTPAARRARKAAAPDCDPPFSIDPQGVRVPRRECFDP